MLAMHIALAHTHTHILMAMPFEWQVGAQYDCLAACSERTSVKYLQKWNRDTSDETKEEKKNSKSISFENQIRFARQPEHRIRGTTQEKIEREKMCAASAIEILCDSQGDTDNGKDKIKGNPLDGTGEGTHTKKCRKKENIK